MNLNYLTDPNKQFQAPNGLNNVAGFLRVYYDGTDDRATTYKNFIGTLNPADIPLDNNGRAVVIADSEKVYRVEVYSASGALLWTQHPVFPQGGGGSEYDGDVSDATATFTKDDGDPSELSSGSTLKVLFTKISKFFASLKSVAFTGSYNDLSNKPSIPAAQVNSDWNANSGVAKILNKPDLSQYIQSSQKGAANGVGTLGSNSVQPYSELYKGYVVDGEAYFKLCRIPKTTTYSGGVSFVFTSRVYNKSSGQVLLWISPCEYQDNNVVYKVVNLFSRANDVSMQFFYNEVTVDGTPYVDVYYRVYGSSHTHVMPLWMRNGVTDMLSTTAVPLPDGAVEMTNRFFNVCAAKNGVGSALVPVYVDSAGNVVPCTMALVASTGSYNDLTNTPSVPETFHKAFTINPLSQQELTATDITNGYVDIELSLGATIGTGLGFRVWTIGLPNSYYSGWKLAQMYDRIEVYTHGENLQLLAARYDDLAADDYGNALEVSDIDHVWNRTFTGNGTRLQEIDAFVVRCYLNSNYGWVTGAKAPIKIWFTSIGQ